MQPMRFYLTSTAEPVTLGPSFNGNWNATDTPFLGYLSTTKAGTASTVVKSESEGTLDWDVLLGRWITDPMVRTGRLSGTVRWVLGVQEANAAADQYFHVHIYVSQGDTTNVRGSLVSSVGTVEWPTAAEGRTEGTVELDDVDCLVGDRLVVEVGYRSKNSSPTAYNATLHYGGTGGTDLSDTSTSVTTQPGWVEFSLAREVFRPAASTHVFEEFAPFNAGDGAHMVESTWRDIFRQIREDGVIAAKTFPNEGNELKVYADSTGMQVKVKTGECWIQGHWGETLTERILPVFSSDPTNPRIDLVVARAQFVSNKIELDVKTGTPAATPTAPGLTQNTAMWEIPLAKVAVAANAVTILSTDVTDVRVRTGFGVFSQWTPPLYYEGTFGSHTKNPVTFGSGNNPQTGWPAGTFCRFMKQGTLLQVRYDFRWATLGNAGDGRIFTELPPGLTPSTHGQSRLQAHLWAQQTDGSDTDWQGTAYIKPSQGNLVFFMFNLSSTSARISWYQSTPPGGGGTGSGTPSISGGYPVGGSLVFSGILEVAE